MVINRKWNETLVYSNPSDFYCFWGLPLVSNYLFSKASRAAILLLVFEAFERKRLFRYYLKNSPFGQSYL